MASRVKKVDTGNVITSKKKIKANGSVRHSTPGETAETIRDIAKNIRDSSNQIREVLTTFRQTGTAEHADIVKEATIAAIKEISDAYKMTEHGLLGGTYA